MNFSNLKNDTTAVFFLIIFAFLIYLALCDNKSVRFIILLLCSALVFINHITISIKKIFLYVSFLINLLACYFSIRDYSLLKSVSSVLLIFFFGSLFISAFCAYKIEAYYKQREHSSNRINYIVIFVIYFLISIALLCLKFDFFDFLANKQCSTYIILSIIIGILSLLVILVSIVFQLGYIWALNESLHYSAFTFNEPEELKLYTKTKNGNNKSYTYTNWRNSLMVRFNTYSYDIDFFNSYNVFVVVRYLSTRKD